MLKAFVTTFRCKTFCSSGFEVKSFLTTSVDELGSCYESMELSDDFLLGFFFPNRSQPSLSNIFQMSEIENYFLENFPGNDLLTRFNRWRVKLITLECYETRKVPASSHTRNQLQSSTATKAEALRHLLFHHNVIHCFSRFRWVWAAWALRDSSCESFTHRSLSSLLSLIWDMVMMITFGLSFFFIPFDTAFYYGWRRLHSSPLISFFVSFIGELHLKTNPQENLTPRRSQISFAWWTLQSTFARAIKIEWSESCWRDERLRDITFASTFGSICSARFQIVSFWLGWGCACRHISVCQRHSIKSTTSLQFTKDSNGEISLFGCSWDIFVVLSLLKFLRMPTFRKCLDDLLHHHKTDSYFILIIKVSSNESINAKVLSQFPSRIRCALFSVITSWSALASSLLVSFSPRWLHLLVKHRTIKNCCPLKLSLKDYPAVSRRILSNRLSVVIIIFHSRNFFSLSRATEIFLSDDRYVICFYYTTHTLMMFATEILERSQVDVSSDNEDT